jgi:hypothetical protein
VDWRQFAAVILFLCITAAHCRQSTNFSNSPRSCSAILKKVLKTTVTQNLTTTRGMKIMPLYVTHTTTTWHNSHRLPLHNSSALPPVHELFKRPSYTSRASCCLYLVVSNCKAGNTSEIPCLFQASYIGLCVTR